MSPKPPRVGARAMLADVLPYHSKSCTLCKKGLIEVRKGVEKLCECARRCFYESNQERLCSSDNGYAVWAANAEYLH